MFLISLYVPDKCELSRKWEKQYHESEAAEIDLLQGIKKKKKSTQRLHLPKKASIQKIISVSTKLLVCFVMKHCSLSTNCKTDAGFKVRHSTLISPSPHSCA